MILPWYVATRPAVARTARLARGSSADAPPYTWLRSSAYMSKVPPARRVAMAYERAAMAWASSAAGAVSPHGAGISRGTTPGRYCSRSMWFTTPKPPGSRSTRRAPRYCTPLKRRVAPGVAGAKRTGPVARRSSAPVGSWTTTPSTPSGATRSSTFGGSGRTTCSGLLSTVTPHSPFAESMGAATLVASSTRTGVTGSVAIVVPR